MYKKFLILSFLAMFLISCVNKEVVRYVDKPVLVFPPQALINPEPVPVIQGDDVRALIDVYLDTRNALYKANEKLIRIGDMKKPLQE